MNTFRASLMGVAILTGAATLLTACGGGGGSDTPPSTTPGVQVDTINGTAATGKAFVGTVVVVNKDGLASAPAPIAADGTFKVNVVKGAPYLIKASNGKTGDALVELYSYLADAQKRVNVTQLTTQAVYDANAQAKLADLYAQWATRHAALTQAKIDTAAKKVAANLNTQLTAAGLNPKAISIFNDYFRANSTGIDKVLDQVKISYNCNIGSCNVNYIVNGFAFDWNYSIDVSGYNIVITPPLTTNGNYDLKVTTVIAGQGTTIVVKGVPKAANKAEFCGDDEIQGQLPANITINSCDYNGTTGAINATVVSQGFSINYTVNYEYVAAT